MGYAVKPMPMTEKPSAPTAAASGRRILIIGQDAATQRELSELLAPEGYEPDFVKDGSAGLEALRTSRPAVVVMDVELPAVSRTTLCRQILRSGHGVPLLILSSGDDLTERILLWEVGADDYVTKPFSPPELLARVRALIRRSGRTHRRETYHFGDVEVIFQEMKVQRNCISVPLTAKEFQTLEFFIRNAQRVVSREELLNEVWGYENYPCTRTVDNHILRLRQKLELNPADPVHFCTVHGIGYQFVPDSRLQTNSPGSIRQKSDKSARTRRGRPQEPTADASGFKPDYDPVVVSEEIGL
jgi:DNA-binding response OmpR family regulator